MRITLKKSEPHSDFRFVTTLLSFVWASPIQKFRQKSKLVFLALKEVVICSHKKDN